MRLLFIFSVVIFSNSAGLAQKEPLLPGDLSVSDILTSLDQTSFRNARIILKDSSDAVTYRPPWDDSEPAKHTFIFTQGFRVTNIVGLTLNSAEWKGPLRWEGRNIAFTFATKEMSEKFDVAFRRAIKLCRPS